VNHRGEIQVTDFGLSAFQDAIRLDTQRRGSNQWMAPELIYSKELMDRRFKRSVAADVYAFAMVCIEVRLTNLTSTSLARL
jgi:serine/threonine protein kinase